MVRLKQRIKSLLYLYGIEYPDEFQNTNTHWSKRFINWLKTVQLQYSTGTDALNLLIKEAEQQRLILLEATQKIRTLSKTERYIKSIELITSVPGIGLITGMMLLAEIEDIKRFDNSDKLAGLIGVVPDCHSSGPTEKKGEMTSRGQYFMRKGIIECSWVAASKDPALSLAYYEYCKRMEPNKAITRIARKLINRIFSVLKNEKKYEFGIVK
jgi:transposase